MKARLSQPFAYLLYLPIDHACARSSHCIRRSKNYDYEKKNNNTEKTVCELHVLPFACRREARGEGGGDRTESGSQTITDTYAGKGCGGEEVTPKWANYFALPFQKKTEIPASFQTSALFPVFIVEAEDFISFTVFIQTGKTDQTSYMHQRN